MATEREKELGIVLTKFLRLSELKYLALSPAVSHLQPELDLLIKETRELINQE